MKKIIFFGICVLLFLSQFGCNNKIPDVEKILIQRLNSDGTTESSFEIDDLMQILNKTKWYKNRQVEMSRTADVIITLYFKEEEENGNNSNQDFRVWLTGGGAEIKNTEEGYGKLNESNTKKLEKIVLKNN